MALAWLLASAPCPAQALPVSTPGHNCPTLLKHSFDRLQDEKPQSLCQYAGKVVLVVNTASYCGYTGQYQGLESLQQRYGSRGFVVLGFPANDFGRQEPGSNRAIADFCENTFGVKFPMFAKSAVVGRDANPLFRQLTALTGEAPQWNFHKYLIDRHGKTVLSYPSAISPDNPSLRMDLEKLLGQQN